ncbi:hypothetical protein RJT34_18716 [Clitoria ternatea]|uniref:IST1-like protein n=1 Tax=Clitoria ternatea TaxID=43366 RepID=A0AAN9PFP6_CLITE
MGLLGKSFTSKIKTMTTLAVSRMVILKNQHKARASYAWSDVAQLLNLGYHDRALHRVEHWITEQDMLQGFAMIESYCNFLREGAEVLEKKKECPIELKEAASTLIFASSRCGEFPELHKIREILTSKFGKEFADASVELHKNNRVNSKMIQKLSSRHPVMEIKMKALKQIAKEIGVTLRLQQDPILKNVDKVHVDQRQDEPETRKWTSVDDLKHKENTQNGLANTIQNEHLSERNEERNMYKDTTAAAAAEARESTSSETEVSEPSNHRAAISKVQVNPMVSSSSKQEYEVTSKDNHNIKHRELERGEITKQSSMEDSHLCPNPRDNMTTSRNAELVSKEHVEEGTNREGNMVGELSSTKSFLMDNNDHNSDQFDVAKENEHLSEEKFYPSSHAIRWNLQMSQTDPTLNPVERRRVTERKGRTHFPNQILTHHEHVDWKMMSVRTRGAQT